MGHCSFGLTCLSARPAESPGGAGCIFAPGFCTTANFGHARHSRSSHPARPSAQPCARGRSFHHPPKPGARNHRQSPAQSRRFLGHAISADLQPNQFDADYISNRAQFDPGRGYTFERGQKRQHRLQAAQDQTTVSRSQVTDNQRTLAFNVAQQFIAVVLAQSTIELAQQDLDSFQKTVDLSESA